MKVSKDDIYSFKKIWARAEELAEDYLTRNFYPLDGYQSISNVSFEDGKIYFTIHYQYKNYRGTDCEMYDLEACYTEEEFCKEEDKSCYNCERFDTLDCPLTLSFEGTDFSKELPFANDCANYKEDIYTELAYTRN